MESFLDQYRLFDRSLQLILILTEQFQSLLFRELVILSQQGVVFVLLWELP